MAFRPASYLDSNLTAQPSNHVFRNSQYNWSYSTKDSHEGQDGYAKSIYKPNLNIKPSNPPNTQTLVSSSLQNYSSTLFLSRRNQRAAPVYISSIPSHPPAQKENNPGTVSHLIMKAMADQPLSSKWNDTVPSRQRASSVQGSKMQTPTHVAYPTQGPSSHYQATRKENFAKSGKSSSNLLLNTMKREYSAKSGILSQSSKHFKSAQHDHDSRESLDRAPCKTPKSVNYQVTCSTEKSKGVVEAFGICTTQGIVKNYNEDGVSIIMNVLQEDKNSAHSTYKQKSNFSYFSVFDGHGGNACVNYLKDNLHYKILNDSLFPSRCDQAIFNGVLKAEKEFLDQAGKNHDQLDKSGACCLIVLFKGTSA